MPIKLVFSANVMQYSFTLPTPTRLDKTVLSHRAGLGGVNLTITLNVFRKMPTSDALPTSHHFHPSLSPVVSLSLGILHEWMRMRMLAKPSSNLLQRIGGDHRGGRAQPG